jgi:triosephosphate isomerase
MNEERIHIDGKNIEDAEIIRCKFRGEVTQCDLQGCTGTFVNLDGMNLTQSTAKGADVAMTNLSGARFSGCDLSGVEITSCKLDGMTINGISVESLLNNYKENITMKKNVRKAIIAGNWKMNKTRPEAKALLEELKPMVADVKDVEIVACVPFTNLETALSATAGTNIKIGAENCHFEKSGAFTGEISADMLAEMGVEYVVLGHSERRQYFAETDETVNKRTKAALAAGLKPIVCVGELLWERECNITEEVIARQIKLDFFGISADDLKKCVIAYEPVWAIGTGKTATADQAEEVCAFIRATLAKLYGADVAETITVQYGGSMNAKNAAELLSKTNVDGGLIGGASLKAADFTTIITAAVNG